MSFDGVGVGGDAILLTRPSTLRQARETELVDLEEALKGEKVAVGRGTGEEEEEV